VRCLRSAQRGTAAFLDALEWPGAASCCACSPASKSGFVALDSEARDQVLANIEKAKELEEKTREMAENASEFASLARKIREKSERSNSFW
jgi:proteasome assembly chaperone (PAC2) family protein